MNIRIFIKSLLVITLLIINSTVMLISAERTSVSMDKNNEKNILTVKIYDTREIQSYDIFLSDEQEEKLDNVFENIRSKLKNSNSYSDDRKILSYALNSFKELGLITDDNNFRVICKLLITKFFINNIIKKAFNSFKDLSSFVRENILCTIVGKTNCTHFFRMFRWPIWYNWPVGFNNAICFGTYLFENVTNPDPSWSPAVGWVNTNGLYGDVSLSGSFYGGISPNFYAGYTYYSKPGVSGFTGFKFVEEDAKYYFYGAATRVKLDTDVPPDPES